MKKGNQQLSRSLESEDFKGQVLSPYEIRLSASNQLRRTWEYIRHAAAAQFWLDFLFVHLMMFGDESISLLLGYASILSWLGAQFPQIVVNWRRKSVDGLALPFLANWLLGDTANLIGCLLTNQLPFQTYLAIYFVFIDACLVLQYIYYDVPQDAKALTVLTSQSAQQSRTSLLLPPGLAESPEGFTPYRRLSRRPRSLSYSQDPIFRAAATTMALAASDVGQIEPQVNVHATHDRIRSRTRQRAISLEGLPESVVAETRIHDWGGRPPPTTDDASEDIPSTMSDSFHSEGGGRSRSRGKHVSWGHPNAETPVRTQSPEALRSSTPPTIRGRQLTRSTSAQEAAAPSVPESERPARERRESAASAVSAGASRRSASIIFLGVFALFGFSSHSGLFSSKPGPSGVVLNPPLQRSSPPSLDHSVLIKSKSTITLDSYLYSTPLPESDSSLPPSISSNVDSIALAGQPTYTVQDDHTEKVIGRISAWTCTTLYLTSRLPQIWKNYARKSVEGLSMYLFTFAFFGNLFYVLSILTNSKMDLPAPLARQFLRESIPYLLGSGGTLMFDITIVSQSFIYSPSRRLLRSRSRRKSWVASRSQEERGLLATEEEGN